MKITGKICSAIIYLSYAAVGILSLLVLVVSLVTTVVFRQYEQNDLFDFVADKVPLLLLSLLAVLALILAVEGVVQRRESGQNTAPPAGNGRARRVFAGNAKDPEAGNGGCGQTAESQSAGQSPRGEQEHAPFPWVMLLAAGAVSLFLVLTIRGLPTADAKTLDEIVNQFREGDYSALLNKGGYLDVYPFQIFYVYIGEVLALLFGQSNYIVYQLLNVAAIEFELYFLYQIAWELFGSRRICRVMQVLSCGAFCLFVFATFIYQDVWSLAVQTGALYLQILYMKRGRIRYEVGSGACIAFAYLLKGNSLIALIAMVLLLLVDAVWKRRSILISLLLCAMLAAMTFGASAALDVYTVNRTGIDRMPEGMSSIAYIAMGMQTAEGKCGWYNGFTVNTYSESGYDMELTNELAMEAIRESIGEFRNSGRYFVNFYYQKFISQWGDPTCVSMREMENTSRHTGELSALQNSLIFGVGGDILQWVMNVFHSMIYLGMVIYTGCVIFRRRKAGHSADPDAAAAQAAQKAGSCSGAGGICTEGHKEHLFTAEEALLLIFIFGGMLFHELWEASGRYTMRYYLTMLPLAAWGISALTEWMEQSFKKISGRLSKTRH